jgi:hypothetical protein
MLTFAHYWLRARSPELVLVLTSGVLGMVFWSHTLPTTWLRPDLSPEQMVQLLAAVQACTAALAMRLGTDQLQVLASASTTARRALWMLLVLVLVTVSVAGAITAMPQDVALEYARNVAAYLGLTMLAAAIVGDIALAVPWLWFAAAMTAGRAVERGSSYTAWWAYPLQDATWHPEVGLIMLVVGAVTWVSRV